jgi:hypothetical protein
MISLKETSECAKLSLFLSFATESMFFPFCFVSHKWMAFVNLKNIRACRQTTALISGLGQQLTNYLCVLKIST